MRSVKAWSKKTSKTTLPLPESSCALSQQLTIHNQIHEGVARSENGRETASEQCSEEVGFKVKYVGTNPQTVEYFKFLLHR